MINGNNRKIVFEPGAPEFSGPAGKNKSRYITPESTRGESNRWQYTLTNIRAYEPFDLEEFARLYKESFAEPPWNESRTDNQVNELIELVQSQKNPILLVAENCFYFQGLACGYQIPAGKYRSLEGQVSPEACYIAELAVTKLYRKRGIGSDLGLELENEAYRKGMPEIVAKTDRRNTAAMALFKSLGYTPLDGRYDLDCIISDTTLPDSLYLAKRTELRELSEP